MEAKYNRKRAASQIKRHESSKAVTANSDRDARKKVPRKNKASNSFLPAHNQQVNEKPNNKGYNHYCVLVNRSVMPNHKYKLHFSENCFGKRSGQESITEGLGWRLGNSDTAVKQYQKSYKKWKREIKYIKKQKKFSSSWPIAQAHVLK